MLNVAFGFDKRSCNISNVGFDFDSDMSQVLVLISVSAQRGPGSICWFRTPTNEFRLSLVRILLGKEDYKTWLQRKMLLRFPSTEFSQLK